MSELLSSSYLIWGVFPYFALLLFFVVPFFRMLYRPFGMSTRASGIFLGRDILGPAAHLLHWGIFLAFFGHLFGLIGGLQGWGSWVGAFYWMATIGGLMAVTGSVVALVRRAMVPEVRAMSSHDDYAVHAFLILIMGVAIYQALAHKIWGVAYTAAPWFASLWQFSPQPELMVSAPWLTKVHVFLAFLFAAYFPFTKLIHAWTLPVNYLARPYQVLRTTNKKFQNGWTLGSWEFKGVTDKSYMTYLAAGVVVVFLMIAAAGPDSSTGIVEDAEAGVDPAEIAGVESPKEALHGMPLYVSQCARCHGLEGAGDGPGADSPTFSTVPRDLTAGHYRFVSTLNSVASDADLRRSIVHGLNGSGMPGFRALSDSQVNSLVKVVGDLWQDRPAAGPTIQIPASPESSAELVEAGKELYANLCSTCHGADGSGDGVAAAGIVDAEGNAIRPRALNDEPLKAGQSQKQVFYRIAAGIPAGNGGWLMPRFGESLSAEQVWALVAYLESSILPDPLIADAKQGQVPAAAAIASNQ